MGAWIWDEELKVGIITEIDETEALQPFYLARKILLTTLVIAVILVLLLTITIIKQTSESRNKLLKLNEQLEEKVEIRTKEISMKTSQVLTQNEELIAQNEQIYSQQELLLKSQTEVKK